MDVLIKLKPLYCVSDIIWQYIVMRGNLGVTVVPWEMLKSFLLISVFPVFDIADFE